MQQQDWQQQQTVWKSGSCDISGISPALTSSAVVMASVVFPKNVQALSTSLRASHSLRCLPEHR